MKEEIFKKLQKVGYKFSFATANEMFDYKTESDWELFNNMLDIRIMELRIEKLKRINKKKHE